MPRDAERLVLFYEKLKEIHKSKCPYLRFGQMIVCFQVYYGDIFNLEEDEFIKEFTKWASIQSD